MENNSILLLILNCVITIIGGAICTHAIWRVQKKVETADEKESSLRNSAVYSASKKDELIYCQMASAAQNLWRAVVEQDKYIGPLNVVSWFNFENTAQLAVENEKMRTLLAKFSADLAVFDVFSKSDVCIAAECSRLFVIVEAYNLFNCRMRLLGWVFI